MNRYHHLLAMLAGAMINPEAAFDMPKTGNTLADGKTSRPETKPLREFKIKGHTIMSYNKAGAISRLKHQKKI